MKRLLGAVRMLWDAVIQAKLGMGKLLKSTAVTFIR